MREICRSNFADIFYQMNCPKCSSDHDVDRVPRSAWMRLIAPSLKKYKCQRCHKTFYRSVPDAPRVQSTPTQTTNETYPMEQLRPTFTKKSKLTLLRNVGSLFMLLLLPHVFYGAAISSTATGGNWNATGSWVGGVVPGVNDGVTIVSGATITVTANASCLSVTFPDANTAAATSATLSVNNGITLSITNGLTITGNSKGNDVTTISGSGSITCSSISHNTVLSPSGNNSTQTLTCSISTLTCSGNLNIQCNGTKYNIPTFTFSGTTLTIAGYSSSGTATAGTVTFALSGTPTLVLTGATPFSLGGSGFTNTVTLNPAGSTVNYNSSSAQAVYATTYSNLKINNTNASGAVLNATTTVTSLTIGDVNSNSIFRDGGFTLTPSGTSTLTISNSGTYKIGNGATATSLPTFTNYAINTTGTVDFASSSSQTIPARNFFNITNSGNGARTLNSSGTIGIAGSFTQGGGTYTIAGSTVSYNNLTGGQTVTSFTYNNLTMANTSGTQTAGGNLTVNGTLTTTSGGTLALGSNTLGGTLATITNGGTISTQNTSSTPIPTGKTWGGTIDYAATSGATTQTVVTGTYNNLTISGAGSNSKIAGGDITVNSILNLSSSNYSATQGCLHMNNGASEYVLTLGSNTATVTGKGDATGIVSRTISVASLNTALSFNNANTTINLRSYTTLPGGIRVKLVLDNPGNITGASSVFNVSDLIDKKVKRYYQVIYTGTAPVNVVTDTRLAFQDAERETLIPSSSSLIDFWDCHVNTVTPSYSTHSHGHTSDFADAINSIYYVQLNNKDLKYLAPTSDFADTTRKYWYLALSNATANAVFWTGVGSNGGWDKAVSNTSDLVIPAGLSTYPSLAADLTVKSISIASGATLDGAGKVITVEASTASGVVAGWMNSGTFIAGTNGKVVFTGNNVSIGGNNTFNDLEFSGTSAQIVSGSNNKIRVKGAFKFTGSGSFATNGNLVIASDVDGTGRIDGTVSGKINGTLAVQRYLPATGRRYRFLSVPVVDATAANWRENGSTGSGSGILITGSGGANNGFDESTTNAPSAFWYDETKAGSVINPGTGSPNDPGWTSFTFGDQREALTNGKGYRVLVRGDRTISLTTPGAAPAANITTVCGVGTYPTSPVVINVTKTGTNDNSGFNLVGNPYPSAISWAQVTKTNVDGTYYVYTPSTGTYGSWTGSTGTNDLTDVISSSQGFFVKATAPTGSISIPESAKTTEQGSSRFKTALSNHLRLTLTYDSLNADEQVIHFRENASSNFDNGYDAYHLNNSSINFSSLDANGVKYSINSLPPLIESAEVPLSIEGTTKATYTLKISERNSFAGHQVFLKDKLLNTITEITSDVQTIPVVHDAASELKAANRFSVVFTKNASGMNEVSLEEGVELYPNPVKNDCYLVWKGMRVEPCTYSIYDEAGRSIAEGSLDFGQQRSQKLDMTSLQNGIYFIAIHTSGNRQVIRFVK